MKIEKNGHLPKLKLSNPEIPDNQLTSDQRQVRAEELDQYLEDLDYYCFGPDPSVPYYQRVGEQTSTGEWLDPCIVLSFPEDDVNVDEDLTIVDGSIVLTPSGFEKLKQANPERDLDYQKVKIVPLATDTKFTLDQQIPPIANLIFKLDLPLDPDELALIREQRQILTRRQKLFNEAPDSDFQWHRPTSTLQQIANFYSLCKKFNLTDRRIAHIMHEDVDYIQRSSSAFRKYITE